MARVVYQYKPYVEDTGIAVGILLPFNKAAAKRSDTAALTSYSSGSDSGGSVFALSYTTEEQAISNLKNLILTGKGERLMQPNFGTLIRRSLFEQNTPDLEDTLSSSLEEDITYWLPYIVLNGIDVVRNEHTISIRINFRVTNRGANLVINVLASENSIVITDGTPRTPVGQRLVAINTIGRGV